MNPLKMVMLLSMFSRYKGYYEYAKSKGVDVGVPVGLDVLIDGIVPTGILLHHLHVDGDFDSH